MPQKKIVHLSTFGANSGAGIAAVRLSEALCQLGFHSEVITLYDQNNKLTSPFKKLWLNKKLQILLEKILVNPNDKSIHFSSGKYGTELDSIENKLEKADFIHIHWVQNNFISLHNIQHLLTKYKKKIIFNLHDSWFYTGGCHITLDCEMYTHNCDKCPRVAIQSRRLVKKMHRLKKLIFAESVVCTPSLFLAKKLDNSVINPKIIKVIPNTIDTKFISSVERFNGDEKIILFSALNISNEYKGLKEFIEALKLVVFKSKIKVIFIGDQIGKIYCPINSVNIERTVISSDIRKYYEMADLYVTTSHEESFGQTVTESISAGTPVVAFNNSGPAEIIIHKKNGYLASFADIQDLARGIEYTLYNLKLEQKYYKDYIEDIYGYQKVAQTYSNLYSYLLINQ